MTELELLSKKLKEAITPRKDALAKGAVPSWDEYKYLTGVITGLQAALDAVEEAQKRYIEN